MDHGTPSIFCFVRVKLILFVPNCMQDFSADVTTAVTEDSRHKKLEAFADLSKAVQA